MIRREKSTLSYFWINNPTIKTYWSGPNIFLTDIVISSNDNVYVCGYKKHSDNTMFPYLAKFSSTTSPNFIPIGGLDGDNDIANIGFFIDMNYINENGIDYLKIFSSNRIIDFKLSSNEINIRGNMNWGDGGLISFNDKENGFYIKNDYQLFYEGEPDEITTSNVFKTSNGGGNWYLDFQINSPNGNLCYVNKFNSYYQVTKFSQTNSVDKKAISESED